MGVSIPESWASITITEIDLGDILGPTAVAPRESATRAAGAFATPARELGEPGALQILSGRDAPRAGEEHLGPVAAATAVAAEILPDAATAERADLRTVHTLDSASGTHVVMQQQMRGHDVVGARMLVHEDERGTYGFNGSPIGDLAGRDPGPPPKTDPGKVRGAIRSHFLVAKGQRLKPRLVVMPENGEAVWAWFAKASLADPVADVRIFLAADTLEPLLVYPASVSALYGEATVFRGNPARSNVLERVCLWDLGPEPSDSLLGAALRVQTGRGNPFMRPDRDFSCADNDAGFDEAAAYFHLSVGLRQFGRLVRPDLFEQRMFQPLTAIVHDDPSVNNAYFHPDRGLLTFGDFVAVGANSARSADMVMHELTHAVTHAICRLSDTPAGQPKALNEGYSDYFASSFLDDPRFGDYVTGTPAGARNCARPGLAATKPLDDYDPYALGELWANVLWGIRGRLGQTVADAVVVESLYFAQTLATVHEGLGALHMADAALFPGRTAGTGRHADVIEEEFTTRFP